MRVRTVPGSLAVLVLCVRVLTEPARAEAAARPRLALPSVEGDADDCAIWIHPTDPALSLVIGNDKAGKKPGLYVYDLNGTVLQFLSIAEPSNLDVRRGLRLRGRSVDVCVVVDRRRALPKVYAIDPATRLLSPVHASEGERVRKGRPYGFALYRRPSDGAVFAFVSKLETGANLQQFQLVDDGAGKVAFRLVREFGGAAIRSHVEGMAADDELGYLYASDELHAVLKFHADPAKPGEPVARFATGDGIEDDREGIAIYKCTETAGYLLVSSQGNDAVKVYRREGNNEFLTTVNKVSAHRTDGLDATSCPAGPRFPHGFLVCHNDRDRNFVLYAWEDVAGGELAVRKGGPGGSGGVPDVLPPK